MTDDCYNKRINDGVYDSVIDQLKGLGPSTLALANLGEHFFRRINPRGHYTFIGSDETEFTTLLMGEIYAPTFGTINRAAGNHFAGNGEAITDSSQIKDVLVLGTPGLATRSISRFFASQVATLNQIRLADEDEEYRTGNKPLFVKEALRSSSTDTSKPLDLIAVHLPLKYIVPADNKSSSSKADRIIKKRSIDDDDDDDDNTSQKTASSSNIMAEPARKPEGNDIRLGAMYDPNLLPDHQGEYFKHVDAKLAQLDIRDIDGKLIAPWEMYEKLRPGTLVLANTTLHCWIIKDSVSGRNKKIYQVNAKSIRVIADSDTPVEIPPIPVLPRKQTVPLASTSSPAKSTDAFNAFQVSPTKKAKAKRTPAGRR